MRCDHPLTLVFAGSLAVWSTMAGSAGAENLAGSGAVPDSVALATLRGPLSKLERDRSAQG